MVGWIPDIGDVIMYQLGKIQDKRKELDMEETSQSELQQAIKVYRERHSDEGQKTLDMFKLDEIIRELKSKRKSK